MSFPTSTCKLEIEWWPQYTTGGRWGILYFSWSEKARVYDNKCV